MLNAPPPSVTLPFTILPVLAWLTLMLTNCSASLLCLSIIFPFTEPCAAAISDDIATRHNMIILYIVFIRRRMRGDSMWALIHLSLFNPNRPADRRPRALFSFSRLPRRLLVRLSCMPFFRRLAQACARCMAATVGSCGLSGPFGIAERPVLRCRTARFRR